MVQLQKPDWVFFRGKVRPWDEAVLHVSTEALNRGLNVYEGLKGYWNPEATRFGIVAMPRHFARLLRSSRLLYIPCPVDYAQFERATHDLVRALYQPERDLWVRATLFVVEGHWGEGTKADLVLTAYHQDKAPPAPIDVGVSTWRRSSDDSLPPRIKTSANYNVARLARIEGRGRGFGEMILLNQWGRVAEATGACTLIVRDGTVITPPPSEGRLESITMLIVASLCRSLGIPFVERPVDRTELYVADEMAIVGTLAELVQVRRIDEHVLPEEAPVLRRIAARFWDAARGVDPHPAVDLSIVPAQLKPSGLVGAQEAVRA
jgi:branched-chain amino acid aminotransferase